MERIKPDTSDCLKSQEIQSLVAGQLAGADMDRAVEHLSDCQTCREVVRSAREKAPDATVPIPPYQTPDTGIGDAAPSKQSNRPTTEVTKIDPAAGQHKPVSLMFPFLAPPEMPDEIGRLGGYRILRVIGEGGMGVVFEAEDPQLKRRVAIKVLKPHGLEDRTRERFLQEARLAASLASPRIVTIHHIGEDRGCPFIVMELLHGESLDTLLKRRTNLPVGEALQITREVAEGLELAHEQGLIHRDIKPANIWLEGGRSGGQSHVKLLDFGIARLLESQSRLTAEGRIVGTPSYLSPEQAYNEPVDGRSDLFSLGCVLYAMLTGNSPFERGNTILSVRAVVDDEPHPLPEQLPKPIATLATRMLSKNPQERPASARQVVEEIRHLEMKFPNSDLLNATLPTAVRGRPQVKRRGFGIAGWSGVAAVALAVVVGLWTQYQRFFDYRDPTSADPPNSLAGTVTPIPGLNSKSAKSDGKSNHTTKPKVPVAAGAAKPPIKVGIIQSLSGPMFTSEAPLIDAWRFAIEEINQAGGVLGGRRIEAIVRDGKSYDDIFTKEAKDLIVEERVATLFGGWRSSCRKGMEVVCREYDHLLVYPVAYEGLEESPYVIYMGGAPNQQILPSVKWAFAFLNKRKFFLIGTDGVYSRCTHEIIKDEVAELGGKIVGNEYRMLGDSEFAAIAADVKQSDADVVINTVVGAGNIALFGALRKAGIRPDKIPVISMNVTEEELRMLSARGRDLAGDYAAWSYFQSVTNNVNQAFLERFHERFGPTRIVNDPMVAAYVGMHMWAKAIDEAKSDRVADIRAAFVRQQLDSPEGLVKINPQNRHAWRMALIGQVNDDYHFEVVWTSPRPLDPQPYPPYRTKEQWEEFVADIYKGWGNHWGPEPTAASPAP